jgi:hypothetical protein
MPRRTATSTSPKTSAHSSNNDPHSPLAASDARPSAVGRPAHGRNRCLVIQVRSRRLTGHPMSSRAGSRDSYQGRRLRRSLRRERAAGAAGLALGARVAGAVIPHRVAAIPADDAVDLIGQRSQGLHDALYRLPGARAERPESRITDTARRVHRPVTNAAWATRRGHCRTI